MDKQLRLPVFVLALIIIAGIGIPPCKATAGECHDCKEPACDTTKTKKCELDACKTVFDSKNKVVTRSCSETPNKAECALEFFENGCVDEDYDYDDNTVLDNCTSGVQTKRAAGVELIKGTETHKTCYCKGKLCNNKAIRAPGSCYVCDEPRCEGQTSYCKYDSCKTTYYGADKDTIDRGCDSINFAECALEFYEDGCVGDDKEDLDKCVNGTKTKRDPGEQLTKARKNKDKKTVCYCKGKDCNNKGKGVTLSVNIQLVFCLSVLATRWVWVINKE